MTRPSPWEEEEETAVFGPQVGAPTYPRGHISHLVLPASHPDRLKPRPGRKLGQKRRPHRDPDGRRGSWRVPGRSPQVWEGRDTHAVKPLAVGVRSAASVSPSLGVPCSLRGGEGRLRLIAAAVQCEMSCR